VRVGEYRDNDDRINGAGRSEWGKNGFLDRIRYRLSGGRLNFRFCNFLNEPRKRDPGGYCMGDGAREQASCIYT